jgi:glycosyltransferase involved in cell wall biosynthesis
LSPRASIVIPSHDEEGVIGRCLSSLLTDAAPGEFDVVVVCNGCTDRTADRDRDFPGVRVVESEVASKAHALNLGDATASVFPRIYLDADVEFPTADARALSAALAEHGALVAAPRPMVVFEAASWPVRAFYRVWQLTPYVREGFIGCGAYGLSAEGRARFEAFPRTISDDGYVRAVFSRSERLTPDCHTRVRSPQRLSDLIRAKTRSRLGGYELALRYPDLARKERAERAYGQTGRSLVGRPQLWPHLLVYLVVNLTTRLRARRQLSRLAEYRWERDRSTR